MSAITNLVKGLLNALYQAIMLIVIPIFTFRLIKDYTVAGIEIGLTPEKYDLISAYIINIGLLVVALSFFAASSPKRTGRKAVLNLLKIFFNVIYIWVYKFSGATVIVLDFVSDGSFNGSVTIDVSFMALMIIGVAFLNIILAIFDLIDWIFLPDPDKEKDVQEYKKKISKTEPIKKETEEEKPKLKVQEEIKLNKKPELENLSGLDDDFLNKPIDSFKKGGA